MVSESLAIEFQEAVKEDYGKDMGLEEATRILSDLVGYFDKLAEINYRILTDKKPQWNSQQKQEKICEKSL